MKPPEWLDRCDKRGMMRAHLVSRQDPERTRCGLDWGEGTQPACNAPCERCLALQDDAQALAEFARRYGNRALAAVARRVRLSGWDRSSTLREHLAEAVTRALGLRPGSTRLPPGYREEIAVDPVPSLEGHRLLLQLRDVVKEANVPELESVLISEVAIVRPAMPGERGDEDGEVPDGRWACLETEIGGVATKLYLKNVDTVSTRKAKG